MKRSHPNDRLSQRSAAAAADLLKRHEIRFHATPPGQREKAARLLSGLDGLRVDIGPGARALTVEYSLNDYTMKGLEAALRIQGFHLDGSLLERIKRALIYFCEDTQLHNMRCPQRLIKQSHEVYVKAWDLHLHGDRDDTPIELRKYQ